MVVSLVLESDGDRSEFKSSLCHMNSLTSLNLVSPAVNTHENTPRKLLEDLICLWTWHIVGAHCGLGSLFFGFGTESC
jgi:hypothetical protein